MQDVLGAIGAIASAATQSATTQSAATQSPWAADSSSFSSLATPAAAPAESAPFASLMTDAVGQVNALESSARAAVDGLMTGSGVDVHEAMIAAQKSEMAFELVLAVRNKAVQAYQQVMGMQF